MKVSIITFLLITVTVILVTVAIFAAMDFPFAWIFYLTVFGEAIWIYSVYRVLTDHYTTNKTFKDFYEDHPIGNEEQYLHKYKKEY